MALHLVCHRTHVSYEQLSIFCALLAILAVSCRQRTMASLICVAGLALLLLDGYTQNILVHGKEKKYRSIMEEPLEGEDVPSVEEEAVEEEPPAPENEPVPEPADADKVIGTNASGHHSVAVDTPPPPDPVVDDDAYAMGLLVGEHSTGVSYARYSRPRATGGGAPPAATDVADEIRGRDRLRRQVPTSFTFGGYRSTTGQIPRFRENM